MEAWRELYLRHAERVYRLAYRITGAAADAEDVVQEVFTRVPAALEGYDERGRQRSWLLRIAAREALSRLRRHRRRGETELEETLPVAASTPRPDAVIDRSALERALAALPDALRIVFLLKEVEGYTHEEIGRMLKIRPGTSEVRLHRAKSRLRELLRSDR